MAPHGILQPAAFHDLREQLRPIFLRAVDDDVVAAVPAPRRSPAPAHAAAAASAFPWPGQCRPSCRSSLPCRPRSRAVVVNLVGDPEIIAVVAHRQHFVRPAMIQHRGQLRADPEQRARLHRDHLDVLGNAQLQIEPALRLQNFAAAHLVGGLRDRPHDRPVIESRAQLQRVTKETIAQQHGDFRAPLRRRRRLAAGASSHRP